MEKLTKRGRRSVNFYRKKSLINASMARSATLSIKIKNSSLFSKIDLSNSKHNLTRFKDEYFPEKTPLPYSRLSILPKLLTCQFILHNYPDKNAKPYPFVFRLSPELNLLSDSHLKKAIQRKLKATLQETPMYWLTTEYDNQKENSGKHLNGEILLYPNELEKCKQAFKELFGLHRIDPETKKHVLNADGTIKQKNGLRFAINFPISSRNKIAKKEGDFYTVFNWVSYSTKQFTRRWYARKFTKESLKTKEPFHFISENLNLAASTFYLENIRK
jgi:hypothetical protein